METKTSFLRNSPETHFLNNRPKELDLQQENKLLIKENNYLHTIGAKSQENLKKTRISSLFSREIDQSLRRQSPGP